MSEPEQPLIASSSQTVGPFFHVGPGASDRCGVMAGPEASGERIRLRIRVLDGDGAPVPDAMIELRQADATGRYTEPPASPDDPAPAFTGFGRLSTTEDGVCSFDTIRPGPPVGSTPPEAAHIVVCLFMRGLLRHLYTRIYFDADPTIERDPVLSLVPRERRETLVARRGDGDETWEWVVRLQGDHETVFFDL
jgi:protocatechuate 3,4-dioxygenase alpha subunit